MRVAIVASPFIAIPPQKYGGTELVIGELAEGLKKRGVEVVVYACGESTINTELRFLYSEEEWPISGELYSNLKDLNHTAWAVADAWDTADIIHLNNAPGLAFSRFKCVNTTSLSHQKLLPTLAGGKSALTVNRSRKSANGKPHLVYTIHHPVSEDLSRFYSHYPDVHYVTISRYQQSKETMPHISTIHHGINLDRYQLQTQKNDYLSFIGRIAPVKGTHLAIEVAKRVGIPLKIAGEIQPAFRDYFESMVKPHIDGRNVEFIGEADLAAKNELLGNSKAMLFPIQWNEPFGLVMVEAMATGTPVLAFPGGSVEEVVSDGVSGFVCRSVEEMAERVRDTGRLAPAAIRSYVQQNFSTERMARDYLALYEEVLESSAGERVDLAVAKKTSVSLSEFPEDPEEPTEPPVRAIA